MISRKMKRLSKICFKPVIRHAVLLLVGIFVGYKLKENGVMDIILRYLDHQYVVYHHFCHGKIPYSEMTEGHIILHYEELKEISHVLNEAKQLIHDTRKQNQIDSHLQFLGNKILRKHGEKVCPELLVRTTIYDYNLRYLESDVRCDIDKIKTGAKKETPMANVNELITFLFDFTEDECSVMEEKTKRMKRISQLYPNSRSLLGIHSRRHRNCKPQSENHIRIVEGHSGNIWNELIQQVSTPYVLLGRDMVDFDKNVDMNRILREFKRLGVSLMGGSFKMIENGHWNLNCYQLDRNLFTVDLKSGYHHSYHDCMYCSYFRGPIVAETQFLKDKLNFSSESSEEMFLDLFLRNLNEGIFSVVCPDIMYHTEESKLKPLPLKTWIKMGQKHEFVSVVDEFGKKFKLPCEELIVKYSRINEQLLTHPCILDLLSKGLSLFMSLCRKRGILCHLTAGNLLGAIKFNSTLPWEYDGDIAFHPDQGSLIDESFEKELNDQGYLLERSKYAGFPEGKQAYFNLVVMFQGHKLKSDIWPMLIPESKDRWPITKVFLDGEWMETPQNPGKDVRDYLGPEVYKHTTARSLCGFGVSRWDRELPESDVPFPKCPLKNNHACLDQYLSDGSIQFLTKR